jgi:hypothetical protein
LAGLCGKVSLFDHFRHQSAAKVAAALAAIRARSSLENVS